MEKLSSALLPPILQGESQTSCFTYARGAREQEFADISRKINSSHKPTTAIPRYLLFRICSVISVLKTLTVSNRKRSKPVKFYSFQKNHRGFRLALEQGTAGGLAFRNNHHANIPHGQYFSPFHRELEVSETKGNLGNIFLS